MLLDRHTRRVYHRKDGTYIYNGGTTITRHETGQTIRDPRLPGMTVEVMATWLDLSHFPQ